MRALLVLLSIHSLPALACDCEERSPEQALSAAASVFEGRVVEVTTEGENLRVTLDVVQSWKGEEHERLVVTTPASDCAVPFAPRTSWLVYANASLETNTCMRSRAIEDADEDLANLGAGIVPVDIGPEDEVEAPATPTVHHGGCASCAIENRRSVPLALPFVLIAISSCRWPSRRARASRPLRADAGTRCGP
jgi:hypothetical protein